jgi:hypothetical protein
MFNYVHVMRFTVIFSLSGDMRNCEFSFSLPIF